FAGFHFSSSPDEKDSRRTIAVFHQGGLGMPDRDYYLEDDEKTKAIRSAYTEHLGKMFRLLGDTEQDSARQAQTVLSLETQLAKASRTRVDLRDPLRNYHLLTVKELQAETPGIAWKAYFDDLGLKDLQELNVGQPDFLKELARLLTQVPIDDWKTY